MKEMNENNVTDTNALHLQFMMYASVMNQALEVAKSLGIDPGNVNGASMFTGNMLYFLGHVSGYTSYVPEKELIFFNEVIGSPITRQNMLDAVKNASLEKIVFNITGLCDTVFNLAKHDSKAIPSVELFNFFKMIGCEFLKRFGDRQKADRYNGYMKGTSDTILEKHPEYKDVLFFEPYKMENTFTTDQKTVKPVNVGTIDFSYNNLYSSVPLAEMIEHAYPTKSGLFPHEILLVHKAGKYHNLMFKSTHGIAAKYGLSDIPAFMESLRSRGFVEYADLEETLKNHTLPELKNLLSMNACKVGGNKAEIIKRVIEKVPIQTVQRSFPERYYVPTSLGLQEVNENAYIIFTDKLNYYSMDIWKANKLLAGRPGSEFSVACEEVLSIMLKAAIEKRQYDDYSRMLGFVLKYDIVNKNYDAALSKIAQRMYIDLNGARGPESDYAVDMRIINLYPFSESYFKPNLDQISEITTVKHALCMTNDDLREHLANFSNPIVLKYEIINSEECAQVLIFALEEEYLKIDEIYYKARERLYRKYPALAVNRKYNNQDLLMLERSFNELKGSFGKHEEALNSLVGEVSKINLTKAFEMWKYLISHNPNELKEEYTSLTSDFFKAILEDNDTEAIYRKVLRDDELCNYLYEQPSYISFPALDLLKWLIVKSDVEQAGRIMNMMDANGNRKKEDIYKAYDYLIPGQNISPEMYDFLEHRIASLKDKKWKSALDVKLYQLRKYLEKNENENHPAEEAYLDALRKEGLPVYSMDIFGHEYVKTKNTLIRDEHIDEAVEINTLASDTVSPWDELDRLVGLENIKQDVKALINFVKTQQLRAQSGLRTVPVSLHLVFTGNPGTGKTTVARILGKLYREIGVLNKGQVVEVDRSQLVAGYVGQTALKTKGKIEEAKGGILFVDEAYSLAKDSPEDFGIEAIETILKAMEDDRDQFVVIVAGYKEEMNKFIDSNPGLKSRFNKYFEFQDYSADELMDIFNRLCASYDYRLTEQAQEKACEVIKKLEENKDKNFANGREVRNIFEKIISNQAVRISSIQNPSVDDISTIEVSDIQI